MRTGFSASFGFLLACIAAAEQPVALYVATDGNDTWSGKAGKPFATLARARDEIRNINASGGLTAGATVFVRGGTYELSEPLVFTPDCCGTENAPVSFEAYKSEPVIVSGGRRITGWSVAGGHWQAKLADAAAGTWNFARLYVNNESRNRPRLPRDGYFFIRSQLPPSPSVKGKNFDRFLCGPGDVLANWSNPNDIELHVFHCWSTSRLRLQSAANQEVTTTGPTFRTLSRGTRYLVENVKEALSQPGEWYLDRPTGALTYLPLPGEDPAKTVVTAPRLTTLLELRGNTAMNTWVHHLAFKGITFAHANWVTPAQGHCVNQAEFSLEAAVTARGARDCAFTDCTFTHTGAYALELGQACKRCRIERCSFTDLGGGGVKIGQPYSQKDDEQVASHNVVRDCLLAHGGRTHPAAVGVWIGRSHSNIVEHNELFDFYYSGISAGWCWGYEPTPTHDNLIAYNHISWMPQEVLGDQGGIYTLGAQPGTVLRGNTIHDQYGVPWAVGIYLDEGSSQILVTDNLVNHVTTHAFHCNYGRENIASNNIFACGMGGHIGRGRAEEHSTYTVEQNILYWEEGDVIYKTKAWEKGLYSFDRNLYWNPNQPTFTFYTWSWKEWQARGQDTHSLIADPLFADPRHGDFTLKADSPAAQIGFKPFDWHKAGRLTRTGEPLTLAPRAFPPAPKTPPEFPPEAITEDFESLSVGEKCLFGATHEEANAGRARVTAETAASGKHSLKFEDAKSQKAFYNPHVTYQVGFKSGLAHLGFDLRWESGAQLTCEWRDYAIPGKEFVNGPAVQVAADGALTSAGKSLLTLPAGQWVHLDLYCPLGAQANGTYDVAVRTPDGKVTRHPGLTFNTPFKRFDWCGFISVKNDVAVFYIDNLRIEPDVKRAP